MRFAQYALADRYRELIRRRQSVSLDERYEGMCKIRDATGISPGEQLELRGTRALAGIIQQSGGGGGPGASTHRARNGAEDRKEE